MGRQLYDYQDDVKFRDYFPFRDKRQRLNFRKIELVILSGYESAGTYFIQFWHTFKNLFMFNCNISLC